LLGRFWGAAPLGIYGRAYQLINLPTENLYSTIGQVAFPALSRVQNEPQRLRSYFLKGYTLFLTLVLPVTVACGLFAEDIVRVFLGARWHDAAPIFRLLAPTILAFAIVHPFGWLMQATGQVGRALKISLVVTPLLIFGYTLGLSAGPQGVAIGFSVSIVLISAPVILWAKKGTLISATDVIKAAVYPVLSVIAGALATFATRNLVGPLEPTMFRLLIQVLTLLSTYLFILFFVLNQKAIYLNVVQQTGLWPFSRAKLKGMI